MATCEMCSVKFSPIAATEEVVTTRVLCPPCLDRYRREKAARRAGAANAAEAESASGAAPAEPPRSPPGPPAKESGGAAGSKRRAEGGPSERRRRGARAIGPRNADEALNKAAKVGGVIALVVVAVAGIVVFSVKSTKDEERAAALAHAERVTVFIGELRALSADVPADAQRILERATAEQSFWRNESIASEVNARIGKAKSTLEAELERKDTESKVETFEKAARDAALKSSDDLAEIRRRADALEARAISAAGDLPARLKQAKLALARAYGARLHEEAKAHASSRPDDVRGQLARYKKAEDELRTLLERAMTGQAKDLAEAFTTELQATIAESDAIVAQTATPEALAALPVRDLLAAEAAKNWKGSEVNGFSYRIQGGVLEVVGPDAETQSRAILSVGDAEQWRDFVVDMDIEVGEGRPVFAARLGRQLDHSTPVLMLGDDVRAAGKPVHLTISMIGSTLRMTAEDGATAPADLALQWSSPRKGAFAFVIPPGVRMRIPRLAVRVLR